MDNPFSTMPKEIIILIMTYLTPQDLFLSFQLSKIFSSVSSTRELWRALIKKHFPHLTLSEAETATWNWKKEFPALCFSTNIHKTLKFSHYTLTEPPRTETTPPPMFLGPLTFKNRMANNYIIVGSIPLYPLPYGKARVGYFECYIKQMDYSMIIGFCIPDHKYEPKLKEHIIPKGSAICLLSNGVIYFHGVQYALGDTFGAGDVIGVGIDYQTDVVFFTKNGVDIGHFFLDNLLPVGLVAPCIACVNPNENLIIITSPHQFTFSLKSYGSNSKMSRSYSQIVFTLRNQKKNSSIVDNFKLIPFHADDPIWTSHGGYKMNMHEWLLYAQMVVMIHTQF
eukprot:TRINITY_DN4579_c0_g1_i1.p1 TRINITY_DN4579_c0_g1~~TRINITY_DN4579_c0_g1_i1.p1  ORF type:complete len:338 (+),score=24.68 TRINITY_DN4579_c0_g1_i1:66-1079(+)